MIVIVIYIYIYFIFNNIDFRHIGQTNMNEHSSRSHTIFRMVFNNNIIYYIITKFKPFLTRIFINKILDYRK